MPENGWGNSLHPRRLRQRLFAWMSSRNSSAYEAVLASRKQALFRNLHGRLLEIGPGGGYNLRFYPAGVDWTGVEPNPYMQRYLQHTLHDLRLPESRFRLHPGEPGGVRLPAGEGSMDFVISSLVLCSVPQVQASLREILRVLKPGGQFVFIEHVAAPRGSRLRGRQDFFQPLWTLVLDGCHPNRETWGAISGAGFEHVEIEHFQVPGAGVVCPHIIGRAVKG
jgi:SAM-dependent methyltransferase